MRVTYFVDTMDAWEGRDRSAELYGDDNDDAAEGSPLDLLAPPDTTAIPECHLGSVLAILSGIARLRKTTVSVLDVGGGVGEHLREVKWMAPHVDFLWTVVDIKRNVERARKCVTTKCATFCTQDQIPSGIFDIIHFGGVLQYLRDWRSDLESYAEAGAQYIAINRTTFAAGEDFIYRQEVDDESGGTKHAFGHAFSPGTIVRAMKGDWNLIANWSSAAPPVSWSDGRKMFMGGMLLERAGLSDPSVFASVEKRFILP